MNGLKLFVSGIFCVWSVEGASGKTMADAVAPFAVLSALPDTATILVAGTALFAISRFMRRRVTR